MVAGSTNTLLANVRGNWTRKLVIDSEAGVRTSTSVVRTQEAVGEQQHQGDREQYTDDPAVRAEPHQQTETDHDAGREQVAPGIAEQAAGDQRRAPDRHRAEPVQYAAVEVGLEQQPGVDGHQQNGHHQGSGEQFVHVLSRRPGQCTAEQVGEHQREEHRDEDRVGHLLGHVLVLQQRPPPNTMTADARPGGAGQSATAVPMWST
jgi:hypothetical protein